MQVSGRAERQSLRHAHSVREHCFHDGFAVFHSDFVDRLGKGGQRERINLGIKNQIHFLLL